jgi:glycine oxidase
MTAPARPDVVVVGAGAIGAACAYELARAGLAVTLVERSEPAAEASGASAGLLSAFTGDRAGAVGRLCRLSRDLYGPLAEALREETGLDIHHERGGHLEVCTSETEAAWARKLAADQAGGPEPVEFLSADALRALEPAVTPEARGGLLLPRNEWVNNRRLVTALVEAARRRGVKVQLGEPVSELRRAGGRVVGVAGPGLGVIDAGAVVLAAGAWSGQVAGVPPALRLRPVKGQILALAHDPPRFRHALLRDEVYLVPRRTGECLVGATVEDGVADKAVTADAVRWLLAEAAATVPALAGATPLRAWAGTRPGSPDGTPVVGPWPDLPGLVVATGHNRSGILLTPVTARIVRDWIADGRTNLPAAPFAPDRLAA